MLSPLLLLALAGAPESPTSMSLSFGFEPRFGTYAALDQRLTSYGYAPVGSAFLPTWGFGAARSSRPTSSVSCR